jgi:hypothetical protein
VPFYNIIQITNKGTGMNASDDFYELIENVREGRGAGL